MDDLYEISYNTCYYDWVRFIWADLKRTDKKHKTWYTYNVGLKTLYFWLV